MFNVLSRPKRSKAGSKLHELLSVGLPSEEDKVIQELEKQNDVEYEESVESDDTDSDFERYAKEEELHEQALISEGVTDDVMLAREEKKAQRQSERKKNTVWRTILKNGEKRIKKDSLKEQDSFKEHNSLKEHNNLKERDSLKEGLKLNAKGRKDIKKYKTEKDNALKINVQQKAQERRLLEAIKTERMNVESLEIYQQNEAEYKAHLLRNINRKNVTLDPGPREYFYSTSREHQDNKRETVNYKIFYKYPEDNPDVPDDWWHFKKTL
jgi:vacuolar protein sorting-associated protein 72